MQQIRTPKNDMSGVLNSPSKSIVSITRATASNAALQVSLPALVIFWKKGILKSPLRLTVELWWEYLHCVRILPPLLSGQPCRHPEVTIRANDVALVETNGGELISKRDTTGNFHTPRIIPFIYQRCSYIYSAVTENLPKNQQFRIVPRIPIPMTGTNK